MTLGQRIQEMRKTMGLSQEGLGEKLGVSRQAISKWESDGAVPEVDKLIALGRLFGVSLNELLQVDCPTETPEEEERSAVEYTRKARRRRILKDVGHALTAVLVAVLVGAVAILWFRVDRLEGALTVPKTPALNTTAPLVSSFDYGFEDAYFTSQGMGFHLDLSLLPAQSMEGMTVTFQLTHPDYATVLIPAQQAEGATEYRAARFMEDYQPGGATISAIFDDGVGQYTQALVRISSWDINGWTWDSLWEKKDGAP